MFAVIHLPDFALQCVLRREPELRARAVAIVDGNLPARVRQMTPPARERGVAAGMTTTQALGRCPGLLFRTPGSLEAESACLLQIAESSSPWIEATGEGVVTLESRADLQSASPPGRITNPLHWVSRLAALDFTARVGIAATPDLALLAAQDADPVRVVEGAADFLGPLPLEALSADAAMCPEEVQAARAQAFRTLHRWGIHTLGAFSALPRDQAMGRLGAQAAELWDRAAGRAERPLRLVRAPEIFAEAMELEHEVETLEPLLFILRRFLEQLAARLTAAYRVAVTLSLRLRFTAGAAHEREFRIPAPTCEVDVLFRILETHLETITAEHPISAVELSAQPARPEQKQFGLFESGLRDPNKFFETLARLHALLGHDRAGTPVLEDSHRPEAFHLETPRFEETTPLAPVCEAPPGPPLQRYRPPLSADVHAPAGRPVRVFSEKAFGEVIACRGPWRSSGEWWGDRAWEREEWDVQIGDALYRLAQQAGAWFLDGAYD